MKKLKFKNVIFILIIPFLCLGFLFSNFNFNKVALADTNPVSSKAAVIWSQLQSDVNSVFNAVSGGDALG